MAYLIDILVLVLFVVLILIGRRRGFIKTVAGLVAFAVALVLASVLSGPVSTFVYNTAVEPKVMDTINEKVGTGSPAAEKIDAALTEMPEFVTRILQNGGIHNGSDVLGKLTGAEAGVDVGERISQQVVAPIVTPLLKMLCTLLLFIVVYIVATILLKALNLLAKLPVLKQLNTALGAFAGAISGVLWVLFAVSLLQVLAYMGTVAVITPDLLESTILVKWLCSINPIAGAVKEAMLLFPTKV